MIYTTLNKIRNHSPCAEGWRKLLISLRKTQADDEPLPFLSILDSNGLDDCLWCLRSAPEYSKTWRLYAVWCARKGQHLITDQRSLIALDIVERHANGEASDKELDPACDAVWAAAWAAARGAAWDAAWVAAWDAVWAAARGEQEAELRRILTDGA